MNAHCTIIVLALLTYWLGLCNASAFYDPGTQRWLNRDLLGDKEFGLVTRKGTDLNKRPVERHEGANLYHSFKNSPLNAFDVFGLGCDCGSGITSGLVPDKPGGHNFGPACKNHDKCYDTYGASKADCDLQFHEEMQDICENSPNSSVGCSDLANIYYNAVKNFGQGAFDAAQKAASEKCEPPKQNSPEILLLLGDGLYYGWPDPLF